MYDLEETSFQLSIEDLTSIWRERDATLRRDRWASFFRRRRWAAHEAPRHLV